MNPSALVRWCLVSSLAGAVAGCAWVKPTASGPAVLWFGGDVHLGQRAGDSLLQLQLDGPLVVNLEGPISVKPGPSSAQRLVNPPDAADRLVAAGVLAVGIDNNHALDDGAEGQQRTVARVRAAGLVPLQQASTVLAGVPVTLLQVDLSAGAPTDLSKRVGAAAGLPGALVVLFHVLAPPLYLPSPQTREAVEAALAAGANAVLVHGSHAVAAVERRGRQVIAWGLGNLAFDCDCTEEADGLLVRLELTESGVSRATVMPVTAGLNGGPARPSADGATELSLLESLGSQLHHRTAHSADW